MPKARVEGEGKETTLHWWKNKEEYAAYVASIVPMGMAEIWTRMKEKGQAGEVTRVPHKDVAIGMQQFRDELAAYRADHPVNNTIDDSRPSKRPRMTTQQIPMNMVVVYLLQDDANPDVGYVGATRDLAHRLSQHNCEKPGGAAQTRNRKWHVDCYIHGFQTFKKAEAFEYRITCQGNREDKCELGSLDDFRNAIDHALQNEQYNHLTWVDNC